MAALLVASLPALGQGGNTLIMARAVDSPASIRDMQTAFASLSLLNMIYEPLVVSDHNLDIAPALAESWEFADDALTLTF